MKLVISQAIQAICAELFNDSLDPELTQPDEQFGDYATNIALRLASRLTQSPRAIAEQLAARLQSLPGIVSVTIAGPGFINLRLSDAALGELALAGRNLTPTAQRTLLEYSCPNPFKELHAGHLYQTIVGDALGNVLTATGRTVFRANFGGDVGLHVAKCLYGIIQTVGGEKPAGLTAISEADRPGWLSRAYVVGAAAYEAEPAAQTSIQVLNQRVYDIQAAADHTSPLAQIYWECREWSYAYFRAFYERVQVAPFDAYYPESETTAPGLQIVNEHRGDVFSDSDGAVIFAGKTADLHTRVFITSKGLPTYETKDLGVILTEYADFTYDERFIMTGNDQAAYMQVVFAALAAFNPDLAARQHHLVHGTIRFGDGKKMSSRLGNVLTAHEVIAEVGATVTGADDTIRDQITLGAIKYSFLKHRLGGDIAFDISESVSLEGNSGPYLQYAHARARSILRKAPRCPTTLPDTIVFSPYERVLARTLANFHEEVEQAAAEQLPHYICTYLYELAQVFNRFYEHEQVIGSDAEGQRIVLVCAYADTLQAGLTLLGIVAPDTM